jgi:hypothetical protein
LNSVKRFIFITVVLFSSLVAVRFSYADAAPFSVAAPASQEGSRYGEQQAPLIAQLKYRAVVEYLQNLIGPRFRNYEKMVTPEFAEKYILDYRVGRLASDKNQLEVAGHLDSDSLKRWVRVLEAKARGNSILRPVFILTSTADSVRGRENLVAPWLASVVNGQLQKFNIHFTTGRAPQVTPPKTEAEIRSLKDMLPGYNLALWANLSPCKTCGGLKSDWYLYNLSQARLLAARTDDISSDGRDLISSDKTKRTFAGAAKQFQGDFEGLVSSGELFGTLYHLTIEGIENYRMYKSIEAELGRMDFVSHATLTRAEHSKKSAEFDLVSQFTAQELQDGLKGADFARSNVKISVR